MKFSFESDQIIEDILHVLPTVFHDDRGWFKEMFSIEHFEGFTDPFVLISESKTVKSGTVRGLHFQEGLDAQGKLVCCSVGSIFDVALDIREGSTTFGKWTSTILSSENHKLFWIPPGFAHGFQTMDDETEVLYFITNHHRPESERVIFPFDDELGIEWPLEISEISEKDLGAQKFGEYIENR